jgi:hypothetical protein
MSSKIPNIVNRNYLWDMMILKMNQSVIPLDKIVFEDGHN